MKKPVTVCWIDAGGNPALICPLPQRVLADTQKQGSLSDFEVLVQLLHKLAPDKSRSQMNNPKFHQSLHGQTTSTGLPSMNTTGNFTWKNLRQAEAFCLERMEFRI